MHTCDPLYTSTWKLKVF